MSRKELLKWDPPVPVNNSDDAQKKKTVGAAATGMDQINRDILNSMFPPIEFTTSDGLTFQQNISTSAVTKSDVQKLKQQLSNLLHLRKARSSGVCLIRSELYSQCFDELIRQVTIDNNVRGRLLMRVRDHYRMTLNAYKQLYETTLDWGNRKSMQVDLGVPDLRVYNQELKERRRALELETNSLQIQMDTLEKRISENKSLREKDHADEITFLRRQGQMIKAQIDMLGTQK